MGIKLLFFDQKAVKDFILWMIRGVAWGGGQGHVAPPKTLPPPRLLISLFFGCVWYDF